MDWSRVPAYHVQDQFLELAEQMALSSVQQRESLQASLVLSWQYNHDLSAREFGNKKIILRDDGARSVRVVASDYMPFRIWASDLDYDVVVCSRADRNGFKFFGWTPRERIIEAPVYWWEPKGVRRGFAHEVEPDTLEPMPKTFNFEESCCHSAGIWSWRNRWHCLFCGRYYDDESARDFNERDARGEVDWREHRGLLIADESLASASEGEEGNVGQGG